MKYRFRSTEDLCNQYAVYMAMFPRIVHAYLRIAGQHIYPSFEAIDADKNTIQEAYFHFLHLDGCLGMDVLEDET